MYILDCTLRDGGYYNNWDFSSEVVEAYLSAVKDAKIDFVELTLFNIDKVNKSFILKFFIFLFILLLSRYFDIQRLALLNR